MHLLGLSASLLILLAACNKPAEVAGSSPSNAKPAATIEGVSADDVAGGEDVKAAVEQLFDLAKKGECAPMAPLIALRNTDTDQDWKRGLKYDVPNERAQTEKQCAELQVMMNGISNYTFKEFVQENESEGNWNIWVVAMHYEDGSEEQHSFAFLPNGNGYILGDID